MILHPALRWPGDWLLVRFSRGPAAALWNTSPFDADPNPFPIFKLWRFL